MLLTEREQWLLNFYRNSELHGALLMGKLARTVSGVGLLVNVTRHCATEAGHAAMLTEVIAELGGQVDPAVPTIQERYSSLGGVPTELLNLLVLSDILERRVLASYGEHLERDDVHPAVRAVLVRIREEEQEHGADEDAWLEHALASMPPDRVSVARAKWGAVDAQVAGEIHTWLAQSFPLQEVDR